MDVITDFTGGTRAAGVTFGSGDVLSFVNLTGGTANNYVEQTATSYSAAELQANSLFVANHALVYVAVQVGSDTYLFADHISGAGADMVIMLQGVGLTGIAAESFALPGLSI